MSGCTSQRERELQGILRSIQTFMLLPASIFDSPLSPHLHSMRIRGNELQQFAQKLAFVFG